MITENTFVKKWTSIETEDIHQAIEIAKQSPNELTKKYIEGYISLYNAFYSKQINSIEELNLEAIVLPEWYSSKA